jgi:hypothetical protein
MAKPAVPLNETEPQKLIRLAGTRVPKAISAIRVIGNLADYKPSKEQTKKLIAELRKEVDAVEKAFNEGRSPKVTVGFQL